MTYSHLFEMYQHCTDLVHVLALVIWLLEVLLTTTMPPICLHMNCKYLHEVIESQKILTSTWYNNTF